MYKYSAYISDYTNGPIFEGMSEFHLLFTLAQFVTFDLYHLNHTGLV